MKKKVAHAVATVFKCLFCNHEASVQCKLNLNSMIGDLVCRICDAKFETQINTLTGACQEYCLSVYLSICLSVYLFVCLSVLLRPAVHLSLNPHVLLSPSCPSICPVSLHTNPFSHQPLSRTLSPAARRTPQTQSTSSPSGWTRPTSYRKRSSGARCRACRGGSRASWATARTTLMPAQT